MDFHTLCTGCRTYRRFKQKQIPEEILDELLENARIANSAMNGQPLRYVFVKTPEAVRKIQSCFHFAAALPKELGQPKEGEQPTAFIILCTEGRESPWTDGHRHRCADNEPERLQPRRGLLHFRKRGV